MKPKAAIIGVKGLPGYGGVSGSNREYLPLIAKNYDITVYALDTHAKSDNYKGVNQHIFKSLKPKKLNTWIFFIKSVLHALIKGNYEIVHLNHGVSGFILPLIKIRYKTITSIHGLNYNNDDKWNRFEYYFLKISEYLAFRFSDIITTVQKSSVGYICQKTNKPVVYIPNGVENHFPEFSAVEKQNVITFSAARLIYLKGVHDFLEALKYIKFEGEIRIIGDLDHVKEYKQRIIKLSEGLNVDFTGLVKDQEKLFSMIASSRLYVFPSYSEGMSNMLLEVASLKVPVIASDIQPNKDVFDDDEVIYFPVGDVKELGEKINYYWNMPDEAKQYSEKAYQKVITEYRWENVASQYGDLYEKMIEN
jgi:glycosyltransferase involved in cell wall biosynthesis